jgi:hypothetical protein
MRVDIAKRDTGNGFEVLRGDNPKKPGVIVRPNGTTYKTTGSVTSVLRGYGWKMLSSSAEQVKNLWRKR